MGGVLRGIGASTYTKYASTPIPCAAEPINKTDSFINQKYQMLFMKNCGNLDNRSTDFVCCGQCDFGKRL